MLRTIPALLALIALAPLSAAQSLDLDDDFPGGNLSGWSQAAGVVTVQENLPPGAWEWVHFRVTGVAGARPEFRTPITSTGDVYRSYHRMVWRPVGDPTWRFMDQGWLPGDGHYWFANAQPFVADEVEIAYWFPYRGQEMREFLIEAHRGAAHLMERPEVIGHSYEGRPLVAFTITEPKFPGQHKRHVVVVARQHGYESLGNLVLEGMVEFLLGPSPLAAALRRKAEFHFYPMANPDAVENGWTREGRHRSGVGFVDLNRDWEQGAPSSGGLPSDTLEIDALRDDILLRTSGEADFLIDLHSHSKGSQGLGWYWWYRGDPAAADGLFQTVWSLDQASFPTETLFSWPSHPTGSSTTTAMAWGGPTTAAGTLGGLGLTLEPIAAPFGSNRTQQRIREGGETIVRGLGLQF